LRKRSYKEALADYQVFQNAYPEGAQSVNDFMQGFTTSVFHFKYTGTSTVTLFDRVDLALCKNTSNNTGELWLEVRTTSTTTNVIASSTLAINGGNVYTNASCNGASTTLQYSTFVLNNNIQWVSGVDIWFTLKAVGTGDTIYWKGSNTYPDDIFGVYYSSGSRYSIVPPPDNYYSMNMRGYALGTTPTNQNQGIYSTSTTAVVCASFDIGCYISNALAWAFYPTATVYLFNSSPSLASTTPFAYIFESIEIWDTVFSGSATGTQTLTVNFAPMGMSTTSLVAGTLASTVQGKSFFTTIRNWIEVFLWFIFAMGILRIALGMIGWTHSFDGRNNTADRVVNITKGTYNRFKL